MECEICLEEYSEFKQPKILSQCGHTFCNTCVLKIWNNGKIVCPECSIEIIVKTINDLPQTNYSLISLQQLL